ncbi:MAG: HAD family phosphatase [Ruminococcus sp.]|nr:HAD family phosphatase [Ruminococcus sp.]
MDNLRLPERVTGVIFDLDGTLISSAHVWVDIDRRFLAKRGFEVPEDYCKRISCLNFREGADYTIERFGLKERLEDIIEEWRSMAQWEYSHNLRLKPGAEEYLKALKARGLRLALATASSPSLYRPVLENNGVLPLFDTFCSTEEVSRSKEHPDVYIYAAGKLGCEIRHCAVFEDLLEGVCSARRAGFFVAACLEDNPKEAADLQNAADIAFMSYEELMG